MTSRQRLDAGHGRQGGRVVTFKQPADPERCDKCARVLLAVDVDVAKRTAGPWRCTDCRLNQGSLFDG